MKIIRDFFQFWLPTETASDRARRFLIAAEQEWLEALVARRAAEARVKELEGRMADLRAVAGVDSGVSPGHNGPVFPVINSPLP